MSGDVVVRVRYRVPAAAPEPCNRGRGAWGFQSLPRFMRATLNTGRILNPVGVVEDGHRKSQRDRVLTGSGRAIRSLTTQHTQPVRIFNLFGLVSAARRLLSRSLTLRQKVASYVANMLPGVSVAAAHDGQSSEGSHHELGKAGQARGQFSHVRW